MENKVKAIIFDWGRTLHNPEDDSLFDGALALVEELAPNYALVLVSLAKSEDPATREHKIAQSGLAEYFRLILVGGEDKSKMYEQALAELNLNPEEVMIVDDRVSRGIAWGNKQKAVTVWFKNGKFADELPTPKTGEPTFTVTALAEIGEIVKNLSPKA